MLIFLNSTTTTNTGPEYLPQHLDIKPLTFHIHMSQKSLT